MGTNLFIIGAGASISASNQFPDLNKLNQKIKKKREEIIRSIFKSFDQDFLKNLLLQKITTEKMKKTLTESFAAPTSSINLNHILALEDIVHLLTENNFPSIDYLLQKIDQISLGDLNRPINQIQETSQWLIDQIFSDIKKKIEAAAGDHEYNYFWKILQKLNLYNKKYVNKEDMSQYIKIINFNYDLLLEDTIERFMYPYNIDSIIYNNCKLLKEIIDESHFYGRIGNGGEDLKFIRNHADVMGVKTHREKFKESRNIYFLGFGFDNQNLKNLGLIDPPTGVEPFDETLRKIYVTNYSSLPNILLKIQTAFGLDSHFVDYTSSCKISHRIGNNTSGRIIVSNLSCEKAVETDFDFE